MNRYAEMFSTSCFELLPFLLSSTVDVSFNHCNYGMQSIFFWSIPRTMNVHVVVTHFLLFRNVYGFDIIHLLLCIWTWDFRNCEGLTYIFMIHRLHIPWLKSKKDDIDHLMTTSHLWLSWQIHVIVVFYLSWYSNLLWLLLLKIASCILELLIVSSLWVFLEGLSVYCMWTVGNCPLALKMCDLLLTY